MKGTQLCISTGKIGQNSALRKLSKMTGLHAGGHSFSELVLANPESAHSCNLRVLVNFPFPIFDTP
jgi:hypothetical protein